MFIVITSIITIYDRKNPPQVVAEDNEADDFNWDTVVAPEAPTSLQELMTASNLRLPSQLDVRSTHLPDRFEVFVKSSGAAALIVTFKPHWKTMTLQPNNVDAFVGVIQQKLAEYQDYIKSGQLRPGETLSVNI